MHAKPTLTTGLLAFMAVGSGLSVASLYYVQPLLELLAREYGLNETTAGFLVTVAQLGYLTGLIAVVPLGDHHERRKLLTVTSALTAVGLLAMGLAPSFLMLVVFSISVGITCVTAQILVPLAAHLATDDKRGSAVGTVMGAVNGDPAGPDIFGHHGRTCRLAVGVYCRVGPDGDLFGGLLPDHSPYPADVTHQLPHAVSFDPASVSR